MKIMILLFFLISCYRENKFQRYNIASNNEFYQKHKSDTPIVPIGNIPYIEAMVVKNKLYQDQDTKDKMSAYVKKTEEEYNLLMQNLENSTQKLDEDTKADILKQQKVVFIFNKDTGDYDVDPDSLKDVPSKGIPKDIDPRVSHGFIIPRGNAYEILMMREKGHTPNKNYIDNMRIKTPPDLYTTDERFRYKKSTINDIYEKSGE